MQKTAFSLSWFTLQRNIKTRSLTRTLFCESFTQTNYLNVCVNFGFFCLDDVNLFVEDFSLFISLPFDLVQDVVPDLLDAVDHRLKPDVHLEHI